MRYSIENQTVHIIQQGYRVYYDDGQPDRSRSVWVYDQDKWVDTESLTDHHLRALGFQVAVEPAVSDSNSLTEFDQGR